VNILTVAKNDTIRIIYKSDRLVSGLDVRFTLLKLDGTVVANDVSADSEITARGVYYYDFTTPNEDTYVVGTGYIANSATNTTEPIVFKIGNANPQTLFHFGQSDSAPAYRIYDLNGDTIVSDTLTSVAGTDFWYTTYTPALGILALQSDPTLFFEVPSANLTAAFLPGTVAVSLNTIDIVASILQPLTAADAEVEVEPCSLVGSVLSPTLVSSSNIDVGASALTAAVIQPVIAADAVIESIPSEANVEVQEPSIQAGAISGVGVVNATVAVLAPAISTGDTALNPASAALFVSVLQPTIIAEKTEIPKPKPPPRKSGWPHDAHLSLGAAPGIALGVVSGNLRRRRRRKPADYITIKFNHNGDIYSQTGIRNENIDIDIDEIGMSPKKRSESGLKLTLRELQKV